MMNPQPYQTDVAEVLRRLDGNAEFGLSAQEALRVLAVAYKPAGALTIFPVLELAKIFVRRGRFGEML